MSNILIHFGLETLGDISLGCMLLLCKHDHFNSPRLNKIVHSLAYQWTILVLFNILTAIITVQIIG
jgi:hypothetical protein